MPGSSIALKAYTVVSALGDGLTATLDALKTARGGLTEARVPGADVLVYLGMVDGLEGNRVAPGLKAFDCRNNRLAERALTTDGFLDAVTAAKARYGRERIAVVLGTSTSGVREGEDAYRSRDADGALPGSFSFSTTQELGSLSRYVATRLDVGGPRYTISTACSSSTKSFADGAMLLRCGLADAVVVGGVDTLCDTSICGFHALELLAPHPCRPNDVTSRGISIGEAGGFALLQRAEGDHGLRLLGAGESSDAHHMSSPHPEGLGARQAMQAALDNAGLSADAIDYVNLHGTGSVANDTVEDAAVAAVLGTQVPVSSTKGFTGHTLGAAGIVDSAIALLALEHGVIPANLNLIERNPVLTTNIVTETAPRPLATVLTNNFGFGGNNCTLIFGRTA